MALLWLVQCLLGRGTRASAINSSGQNIFTGQQCKAATALRLYQRRSIKGALLSTIHHLVRESPKEAFDAIDLPVIPRMTSKVW